MKRTILAAMVAALAVACDTNVPTANPSRTAALNPSFNESFAASAASNIHVWALIDGRSRLILRGNTAQWNHLDHAAPGRWAGNNYSTNINGKDWYPAWAGYSGEVRCGGCFSDVFAGVSPALPLAPVVISVAKVNVRSVVSILQQPSASNNYTAIIEFNDNGPGGADAYVVDVSFAYAPPTAKAGGPYTGAEGTAVQLDGSGSSAADGSALTYAWELGDGATSTDVTPSHLYADNGSYSVKLTVTDASGLTATAETQVTVTNVAPSVNAGGDQTIASGETASFSGTFRDPGVKDMPWSWSWSSGQSGSTNDQAAAISGSEKYCKAGTYGVRLSVTDKDGDVASDALVVTVNRVSAAVDIKPETINLNGDGGGMVIAHVYSTADYDATTLDPATVVITDGAGTGTPVARRNNGTYHFQTNSDLNGDGRNDALIHFSKSEMGDSGDLTSSTTHLTVLGDLADCRQIRSVDAVRVIP